MNFFEHQETARKRTGRLVALFVLAVLAIALLTYAAVVLAFGVGQARQAPGAEPISWFQPQLFLLTTGGVFAVVSLASLYKTASLRGGGRVVAESLGARLLEPGSTDPQERKLLNVVEEMSIASGTPVPPVFVMGDEQSINAFAAGFTPSDAVIGVTRGCMEKLSRDELQGVVAHEFSHVFNGDMRLNIRLIGVLHGILILGLIGQLVLRSSVYSGGASRRRRGGGGGGVAAILAFGLALAVVGWIGTFFGNLIQAAVSRQREFLADASSVQFTRNPAGIAGALKKIGGLAHGSRVSQPRAAEMSHMFFGQGIKRGLTSIFATHPPLVERVRRIEPAFDGEFPHVESDFRSPYVGEAPYAAFAGDEAISQRAAREAAERDARHALEERRAEAIVALVGQPSPAHVERARELIGSVPEDVRAAAREPYGARAVVYALLLDAGADVRADQRTSLERGADPGVLAEMERLLAAVDGLDPAARLPLIDLALPALRKLSPAQYRAFLANLGALIRADERLDAFEWVLRRVLLRHLTPHFEGRADRPVRYYGLQRLAEPCSIHLSTLAHVGHADEDAARAAFAAGAERLPRVTPGFLPRERCSLGALGRALDQLDAVSPRQKGSLLEAGALTVAHDHEITLLEAEVLRAVADSLGCPIPPLLAGQAVSSVPAPGTDLEKAERSR